MGVSSESTKKSSKKTKSGKGVSTSSSTTALKTSQQDPAAHKARAVQALNDLILQHEHHTTQLLCTNQCRDDFVQLHLTLIDCPFVSYTWILSTKTRVLSILHRLEQEHGNVQNIRLFRLPVTELNELHDLQLTLRDLGCVGSTRDSFVDSTNKSSTSSSISYDLVFDFLPVNPKSAILLREPATHLLNDATILKMANRSPLEADAAALSHGTSSTEYQRQDAELANDEQNDDDDDRTI